MEPLMPTVTGRSRPWTDHRVAVEACTRPERTEPGFAHHRKSRAGRSTSATSSRTLQGGLERGGSTPQPDDGGPEAAGAQGPPGQPAGERQTRQQPGAVAGAGVLERQAEHEPLLGGGEVRADRG